MINQHCKDCAYCYRAWVASDNAVNVVLACHRDNVKVDPDEKACENFKTRQYK